MAARSTPKRATYADIEALPKNYVGEILLGGDVKVRAEPFDAIELDLAALWEALPPPPAE